MSSSRRALGELLAWAAASASAYVLLYRVQRRLFTNGLTGDPYALPRASADLLAASRDLWTYWGLVAVVLLTYLWLLIRSRAWGHAGRLAVVVVAVGHLVLLAARPGLSIDVLSYLSHGYLVATDLNPYVTASPDVAGLPYGALLSAEGWTAVHGPTPYGPLWTHLERLAYAAAPDQVWVGLLLLKIVVTGSVFGSGWLIGRIAELVRPGTGRTAVLAWLANPLVVIEFGADGHNDALAIFFALLALGLALGAPARVTEPGRAALAVVALGLGVLTKYTPLVLALPLLVLLVRRRRSWPRLLVELAAGVGVVLGLGWLLWRGWWLGRMTFDALVVGAVPFPSPSPAGWLAARFVDPLATEPSPVPQLILLGVLVLAVLGLSWFRPLSRTAVGWAAIALVALAVLPVYWPWYAGLAVAVLLLRPSVVTLVQALLLTAGSRIAGPYGDIAVLGLVDFVAMFERNALWGVTLPLAGCALLAVAAAARTALRRRPQIAADADRR